MTLLSHPLEVDIEPIDPSRFRDILDEERWNEFTTAVTVSRKLFHKRTMWNVNSTAAGGGVAEMLRSLMAYACGAGVDARWVAVSGDPGFFRVTKLLHNLLHGDSGGGGILGEKERTAYETTTARNAEDIARFVDPDDIVILHDPQTAGMIGRLKDTGATIVWRSHIGTEIPNELVHHAWQFLLPYIRPADVRVFSRYVYVPEELQRQPTAVIAPSIDPFSAKNQNLDTATVRSILWQVGLVGTESPNDRAPVYRLQNGKDRRVDRRCAVIRSGPPPTFDTPLVVQVSRWDRLKDPIGVIKGFADYVAETSDAQLILAGPSVDSVADDPEGEQTLKETEAVWRQLPADKRNRIHLACLPMDDLQENAAIVNALQRQAAVIVQKSLREGFGLTVTEAMWKARPVVAGKIGGVSKQIRDGVTGLLVDPSDLPAFGNTVRRVLKDFNLAQTLGDQAYREVSQRFLHSHHLAMWLELIKHVLAVKESAYPRLDSSDVHFRGGKPTSTSSNQD